VIGVNDVDTVFIPHLQVSNNVISVVDAPALLASNIGADGMSASTACDRSACCSISRPIPSITPLPGVRKARWPDHCRAGAGAPGAPDLHPGADRWAESNGDVDTGSQVTIGNTALQRPDEAPAVDGSHYGDDRISNRRKLSARVAEIKRLELGEVRIEDLAVVSPMLIFSSNSTLEMSRAAAGMNAMRAFDRISIDFQEGEVRPARHQHEASSDWLPPAGSSPSAGALIGKCPGETVRPGILLRCA
jgi:hypothetical protein